MSMSFKNTIGTNEFAKTQLIIFDFDGVFTDNRVAVADDGTEIVSCWRSDGLGLSRIKALNINLYIISTELNPVVSVRATKLGVQCKQGVENKAMAVVAICEQLRVMIKDTVFLGNDINDVSALQLVGMPVVVNDAYPEVLPFAKYRTRKRGGYGAVRELCDIIYKAKQFKNNK